MYLPFYAAYCCVTAWYKQNENTFLVIQLHSCHDPGSFDQVFFWVFLYFDVIYNFITFATFVNGTFQLNSYLLKINQLINLQKNSNNVGVHTLL